MEKETRLAKEDWLRIEKIVAEIVDEDAWNMCSRPFMDKIESSIEKGETLIVSTSSGGDHFDVPLVVQAIPFALSGVKATYVYYKQNGSLPSTAKEFISLIPSTQKEVKEFLLDNYPTILGLLIFGAQVI